MTTCSATRWTLRVPSELNEKKCNICLNGSCDSNIISYCNFSDDHTFCETCMVDYAETQLEAQMKDKCCGENDKSINKEYLAIDCPLCFHKFIFKYRTIEGKYKDGKKDGLYKEYYANGQVKVQCNYINGLMDGFREEFYCNGDVKIKCNYINGKPDGIYEEYYMNKKLHIKLTFINGIQKEFEYYNEDDKKVNLQKIDYSIKIKKEEIYNDENDNKDEEEVEIEILKKNKV